MPAPAKILLVDDEDRFRTTLRKILTGHGLEVTDLSSGQDALAVLQQQSFEVIVLDLRMPGLNGIQTLKAIKELHPEQEVIILTGHASMDDAMEIMELGGTEYLLKPCSVEEILEKIELAVERCKTRQAHGRHK